MSVRDLTSFRGDVLKNAPMGTNQSSSSLNISDAIAYAVQAIWKNGSSPVGTLDIQASNNGEDFSSVLSSPIAVSGNSGNILVNVERAGYQFVKILYNSTSGSGELTVSIAGKRS